MQERSAQLKLKHYLLNLLRMAIGWHFLYEGLVKSMTPGWTSNEFLRCSRWIFSPVLQWMASHDFLLGIVNFIGIWGMILIGLGLMLGCFTRVAAISGAVLLFLYYLASPPFSGADLGFPAEGHTMLVNKDLIEMLALISIAAMDTRFVWGIDRVLPHLKADHEIKVGDFQESIEANKMHLYHRREIIKNFATLPVVGVFAGVFAFQKSSNRLDTATGAKVIADSVDLKNLKSSLPMGGIGPVRFSRLIMDGHFISGPIHARGLLYVKPLVQSYNTQRKICDTLMLCENAGISTMIVTPDQAETVQKYKELYAGKIQTIVMINSIAQADYAVQLGATALAVAGDYCDQQVREPHIEELGLLLDYIRRQKLPSGLGAFSIQTVQACVEFGLSPDFYVKTLHHDPYGSALPQENRLPLSAGSEKYPDYRQYSDTLFCLSPEETIEFMKNLDIPWIASEVLAGGAIRPEDGFRYAFENGADFVSTGLFDFQIVDSVKAVNRVLKNLSGRERPWRG